MKKKDNTTPTKQNHEDQQGDKRVLGYWSLSDIRNITFYLCCFLTNYSVQTYCKSRQKIRNILCSAKCPQNTDSAAGRANKKISRNWTCTSSKILSNLREKDFAHYSVLEEEALGKQKSSNRPNLNSRKETILFFDAVTKSPHFYIILFQFLSW